MYYLHSRYYDPEVCRFINADAFVSTGQGILGYNMFAYCNNDPVNFSDISGSKINCCIMVDDGCGSRSIPDITEQFMELMKAHAFELRSYYIRCFEEELFSYHNMAGASEEQIVNSCALNAYFATMLYFKLKVDDGAIWDLKLTDDYSARSYFYFNGEIYSGEQLGNIHYGYVGSALFPPLVLHLGAGYNQATKGIHTEYLPYYFDEPDDYLMIDYGIRLYWEG